MLAVPYGVRCRAEALVKPPPGRGRTDRAVSGFGRGEAGDDAMQPVRDGPECVVVEGGHLAGVDRPRQQLSQRSQIVVAALITA